MQTGRSLSSLLGFDPEALAARYRLERDKRLRADGAAQYRRAEGALARFTLDPWAGDLPSREPLKCDTDVVVLGGGFGGLLASVRLQEAGIRAFTIIENGADFGGTWYWNRYPGATCDVESYIYLPLLEELGVMPSHRYVEAAEILAHSQAIGKAYDLYSRACFRTSARELRWEEPLARWLVSTDRGDELRARFVCVASGPLNVPKLPGIEGIESFQGHSFHTSRWDYRYTGGNSQGNLAGLRDKRVGVIGTGATAIQCIPHLAASAAHLYVFQRTPSSIDAQPNHPTDPGWFGSLKRGWQAERMDNFNALTTGAIQPEDLVGDGWTAMTGHVASLARELHAQGIRLPDPGMIMQLADYRRMEQLRARVEAIVTDKAVAEALKPYYNYFCKRPCFNNDYLATFNRPNVTLVDTGGRGVERITGQGVCAAGQTYQVDCLIYATGFEVGTGLCQRAGIEVHGRNGLSLREKWQAGMVSLHGMHTHGFPNCFFLGNAQSGYTYNFPHMLDERSRHLAYILRSCLDRQARTVEATAAAEAEWVSTIEKLALIRRRFATECTPGFYNNEGRPDDMTRNSSFGRGSIAFIRLLREWRQEGRMQGLELR